ncbi:MAG TPA: S8 family serine peptidase [Candidatus Deferrimicrobium sp.]|nr:S8 family serine peptidase [Candidatus Deferrimicrobium sp.]
MIRKRMPGYFTLSICLFAILAQSAATRPAERSLPADIPSLLPPRPPALKPVRAVIDSQASVSHVVVKFTDQAQVRFRSNQLISLRGANTTQVNSIIVSNADVTIRRLFNSSPEANLDRLKAVLEQRVRQELSDLNGYYRIDVSDPSQAERLVNDLNALSIVEIAYVVPMPEPAGDIDPPTPDYQSSQDYREAAPAGVDADYANSLTGGDGSGVKIIDIEGDWQTTHEDLDKALGGVIAGIPMGDPSWRNHGTAVIGEMIAGDNGYGVTGICPGADIGMISIGGWSTSEALYAAIDTLQQGDVILIELHAPGPHYNFQVRGDQLGYVCMEYWQDNFDAIQYAWAKGIVVIEAGGNGAEDFDDTAIYGQLFDTTYRYSHAIIVGAAYPAASPNNLQKLGFSNYGERVNLQGYGSGVYTTGYGGLFNGGGDENQYYTASFSGTSSASPIVTGAATCLQGYYEATFGAPLTSDRIRDALVATGTPQLGDTSLHIGPRPNLQAAIAVLTAPPSLYTKPIFIDTAVTEGTIGNLDLWLFNRSASSTLDFTVVGNDSLTKRVEANWLVAVPASGSIVPLDSFNVTVTLDATVVPDRPEKYKGVVEISWGPAGGPLESLTVVPVFLDVPCFDTTYRALSSDDSAGPVYSWISAKDLGTRISDNAFTGSGTDPLDDGTAGPFGIGFSFWFYDFSYTQMHIGVNGAISFTDADLNVGGYFSSLDLPGAPFTTFVSPFWNDLIFDTDQLPTSGVYLYRSPALDTCVIEWYHPANFLSPNDTTTDFEIVLTKDGHMLFQYRDVGAVGLAQTALIGVSEAGCLALSYYDGGDIPTHEVAANEAVLISNPSLQWRQSGDMDGQPGLNIADLTFLVAYLFAGGAAPIPLELADLDCSGEVNVADLTYLVDYLFQGGAAPCYFLSQL